MAKRPEVRQQLEEIASRAGVTVPWDRITINRWRPDTCRCVVEHWFDDADTSRIFWARTTSTCPDHEAAGLTELAWTTVRGENFRKNAVVQAVRLELGDDEAEVQWSFDPDQRVAGGLERALVVDVPRATAAQRRNIQDVTDIRFGLGGVTIR